VVLMVEMKSLLIGEGASPDDEQAIVESIESSPRVRNLIHLKTEHLGPEELLVAAKVEFDENLTMAQLASAIDQLEARVRERVPGTGPIYVEPDVLRGGAGAAEAAASD
jgi:divalent metal cation (Fe/Co/Zn/Cd) transporter